MTESIFTQTKNAHEHDIIFKPRTDDELKSATDHKVPVYTYSDLCELSAKHGARTMLAQMFKRANQNIILLQDPSDMNSGHWISVSRNPKRKEIYFFSTYGGKPDCEKVRWINDDDLRESGQLDNIFNEGLRECQQHGWQIHYNDFPYQQEGDHTSTCGIYTVAFLNSGLNPDQFKDETLKLVKNGLNPAIFYFDKYFR